MVVGLVGMVGLWNTYRLWRIMRLPPFDRWPLSPTPLLPLQTDQTRPITEEYQVKSANLWSNGGGEPDRWSVQPDHGTSRSLKMPSVMMPVCE